MTSRSSRPLSTLLAVVLACGLAAPSSAEDQPTPSPAVGATAAEPSPTEPPADDPTSTPTTTPVPAPPTITLVAPGPVRLDRRITLTATALDSQRQPLVERRVRFQRLDGTTWTDLTVVVTTAEGRAIASALPTGPSSRFRALLLAPTSDTDPPEAESPPVDVSAYPAATRITLAVPTTLIDERAARFTVTMRATEDGKAVPARVEVQRQIGTGPWTNLIGLTLVDGTASVLLTPRVTARYRAVGPSGAWWTYSVSGATGIRILPPGTVVRLPYGSPQPRWMPVQPRTGLAGVAARAYAITDYQWQRMAGVSWHSGCPVGRSSLRSREGNYWAFDGDRRRGRMVVNANAVGKYAAAFARLYAARVPIRRIYPSETFGWSNASHGANDYLAMQSDNTSAFNCRWVTGRPHVLSPHSTGYAIDINTFENPYLTRSGWLPNSWWPWQAFGLIAWRVQSAVVVTIMRTSGFAWTYGTRDSQHFDVRR